MQQRSYNGVHATIPVSIVNGLLTLAGVAVFLFAGVAAFPHMEVTAPSFLIAGFCAVGAMLFYQCACISLGRATFVPRKVLFFSAGIYHLLAFLGVLLCGIY